MLNGGEHYLQRHFTQQTTHSELKNIKYSCP